MWYLIWALGVTVAVLFTIGFALWREKRERQD